MFLIKIKLIFLSYFYSYRIEHIFDDNILQMPRNIRQYILHEKLIYAVYIHRRAIELVL